MNYLFNRKILISFFAPLLFCLLSLTATAVEGDFDPRYYADKYPDVAAVFGDSPELLRMHYDTCGKIEGRYPNGMVSGDYARCIVAMVNGEREAHGCLPLNTDPTLEAGARIRAEEIMHRYSHFRPEGSRFYTVYTEGPNYHYGENIFAHPQTPEDAMEGWMNSPGHNKNILYEPYTSTGVFYIYDPDSRWKHYWVQHFMK